ncbi:unnamed protein product [Rotaria magnacalcarata]|uniref:FLYWCH-type domain-containing protein n=2 Tax=Rotaria magnacalcarata TaxID=392030 RepID=A0A8S3FC66_9BILA|nr:unnamed protein product [Rotaria magnacalcarata]
MLLFTSSNRGQPILNYNSHQYTKKRVRKTSNEWRCRDRGCTSTISLCTVDAKVLREPSTHICQQSASVGLHFVWLLERLHDPVCILSYDEERRASLHEDIRPRDLACSKAQSQSPTTTTHD